MPSPLNHHSPTGYRRLMPVGALASLLLGGADVARGAEGPPSTTTPAEVHQTHSIPIQAEGMERALGQHLRQSMPLERPARPQHASDRDRRLPSPQWF